MKDKEKRGSSATRLGDRASCMFIMEDYSSAVSFVIQSISTSTI